MIPPSRVDNSAIELARYLGPAGGTEPPRIDRGLYLPVAALAIMSSQGNVAICHNPPSHSSPKRSSSIPTSQSELPELDNYDDRAAVAGQVAAFLSGITGVLGLADRHIGEIRGLMPPNSDVPVLLAENVDGMRRRLAVLPFAAILTRQPQILSGSWHSKTEAAKHLTNPNSVLSPVVKRIILGRLFFSDHANRAA